MRVTAKEVKEAENWKRNSDADKNRRRTCGLYAMPVTVTKETDDSDAEDAAMLMMDLHEETPESDKSDSDESGGSPDEDDSSEMDEAECERRRSVCLDDMADLERQFTLLKEQLYGERMTQVSLKLEEVRLGKAPEYLQPLEDLQENMRIRVEVAGVLRELRVANIHNKYEAEQLAVVQNYENDKVILRDCIQSELEEKIRRLEEDRNSIDITSDLFNEQFRHKNRQKNDPMNPDKRKKPVTVSDPFIVYMLREEDILEDWAIIKKALKATKRKSELHV